MLKTIVSLMLFVGIASFGATAPSQTPSKPLPVAEILNDFTPLIARDGGPLPMCTPNMCAHHTGGCGPAECGAGK